MEIEVKKLGKMIDQRMKFCVAEISVFTPEERLKQCPECNVESELQKYVLTEQGRALRTTTSFWFTSKTGQPFRELQREKCFRSFAQGRPLLDSVYFLTASPHFTNS